MSDDRTEIYRLLKIGETPAPAKPVEQPQSRAIAQSPVAPLDLPIVDLSVEWEKPLADQIVDNILAPHVKPNPKDPVLPFKEASVRFPEKKTLAKKFRGLLVYPVIFVISFSFFYVLLNFSSLVSQVSAWFAKPEEEQILQDDLPEFYTWIGGYYFAVQEVDLLKPANDIDKDGLSNLDEFTIKTNPTLADSDSDGTSDGIEVINSTNPWGSGPMTNAQKKLRDEMDVIKINNRISFNSISALEIQEQERIDYDLTQQGTLSIPKLGLQVPIIWTKDPAEFDVDLTKGVVHYPGTALPGENGTVYISGHSSDYPWKRHPYKQVFAKINALENGDDIFVEIRGLDGKIYNYRYQVNAENIYKPDDQAQFVDNSAAKLNLSTCWPIGTQRDRYVVSATLVDL